MHRLTLTKPDIHQIGQIVHNEILELELRLVDIFKERQDECEHRFDDRYMKKNDKKKTLGNPGNNPGSNPNNKTLLSLINRNRDIIFFIILLGAGLGGFLIAIGVIG